MDTRGSLTRPVLLAAAAVALASISFAQAGVAHLATDSAYFADGSDRDTVAHETFGADALADLVGDALAKMALDESSSIACVNKPGAQSCQLQTVAVHIASNEASAKDLTRATKLGVLGQAFRSHVPLEGSSNELVARMLEPHSSRRFIVGDCEGRHNTGFKSVNSPKQHLPGGRAAQNTVSSDAWDRTPHDILICGSSDTLTGDASVFLNRASAVKSASAGYVATFIAASMTPVRKRRMLLDFDVVGLELSLVDVAREEYFICDDTCNAQINAIGAAMLLWTLALTVMLGCGLLHNLDTPSYWFKNYENQR